MDLFAPITSQAVDRIKAGATVSTSDELHAARALAERQKPYDYDAVIKGLASRYQGNQRAILREALRVAYPSSYESMPVDPVNWLRFFSAQDAGVYTSPASRVLVGEDGEELDPESPEAMAFADAVEQVGGDRLMAEVEQRCLTGAKAVCIVVGWRKLSPTKPGKLVASQYWGSDVFTIAHPSALEDPDALTVVGLRQARAAYETGHDVWWVWSRSATDGPDGPVFGPWQHVMISEDGKHKDLPKPYDGVLPIVFCRSEDAVGSIWPDPDRDVSANVDNLNVGRSNRQHIINMQAHAVMLYQGTMLEASTIVAAPDRPIKVMAGENLSYLTANADHAAILASSTRDLEELGVSHGNSPDAYAVEAGAPMSGVSRLIANAPHDERVARLRPLFKQFEELALWIMVIDLINRHVDGVTIPDTVYPRVTLGTGKVYETDAEKVTRVGELLTMGLIDKSRAAVMVDLFADKADADAHYAEVEAKTVRPLPGALTGSPFASTRETTATVEDKTP
jgi:hypothetical protein